MMAYKLEYSLQDHQEALQETLLDWSKDDHDIYIVSDEGHKIFTHKILLYFYSHTLGTVLDSLPPSTSTPGISVSASSSSISNLLKLLTTGRAASNNKDTLVNVKEAAKDMGISLGNCMLEAKKTPGQTIIRKLPAKTDVQGSPANLSVFRNRDSGIAGIAKWNTVITAKNKVTQIPKDVNPKDDVGKEPNEHDENETEINEPKLPCEFCLKVFSGKRNLRKHKYRKHQNGSKSGKGEINAIAVKNETQEDISSDFQCNSCDREFNSERKLMKHVLQHSNRYSCDQCDKSFQVSSSLKNHKNIHLDEKPFKCEVCDKEFTQAGNLKTHTIKYHGEVDTKPNSSTISITPDELESCDKDETTTADHCGYCDEQFDYASELNSHMVLMHSIQKMIESSD